MSVGTRIVGTLLLDGRYRLESPLAVGGMGTIWRAMHTTLERVVAVKFIDVGSQDDAVIERFLREAMVVAAIHHPNVIDVLDFGRQPGGEAFMVMEFLEGQSLDDRLGQHPGLTTIQVVQIAGQMLSGLEAVHRSGIVHCDVKPGNVVLTESDDGEPFARLLDFGNSCSLAPCSDLRPGPLGLAAGRVVFGTPEYMSPEQARGSVDVDVRADVYSVAVVLYQALSGKLPYPGDDPFSIVQRVLRGECTPLGLLRPDISEITDVIDGAMQHDRDQRPTSAREFRRLLFAAAGLTGDPTGLAHLPARSSAADLPLRVRDESGPGAPPQPPESAVASLPGRVGSGGSARVRPGLVVLGSLVTLALTGAAWALFAGSGSSATASAALAPTTDRARAEVEGVPAPIASHAPITPRTVTGGTIEAEPNADVRVLPVAAREPAAPETSSRRSPRARATSEPGRASSDLVRHLDF